MDLRASKPSALTVRPIADDEYAEAAHLVLDSFLDATAATMSPEGVAVVTAYATAESLRARDIAGARTIVAVADNAVVGVLHITDGTHIALFFVSPTRHRQGIGKALLAMAETDGVPLATVNASLNAIPAYERLEFHATGPAILRDGIRYVPMIRAGSEDSPSQGGPKTTPR